MLFKSKKVIIACFCFVIIALFGCNKKKAYAPESIIWNEFSKDETACFPFGNGEIGGNVWTEKNGIYIYLARNDCFSEYGRILKAGKLKLSLDSCLLSNDFFQKLDLENGMIDISSSKVNVRIFADSQVPVIWIHGKLSTPSNVSIKPVIWRNTPHKLTEGEKPGANNFRTYNGDFPFAESADRLFKTNGYTGFLHHNDSSIYKFVLNNNHLQGADVKDPYLNRTFGAMYKSDNLTLKEEGTLESTEPVSEFTIKITVTSFPDCSEEDWKEKTLAILDGSDKLENAEARTKDYWNELWERSYLKISTPDTVTGEKITELYNCQRWTTLCAGKSSYPIKFNGSIFTVSAGKIKSYAFQDLRSAFKVSCDSYYGSDINPDFRLWGESYWWQNTRLPYFPLLKTGDWETIQHLAAFYHSVMPALKEQAKLYYGAEGAIIPETITHFGTFSASDYGIGREELGASNLCIRHIFQDPLELIHMMMDCYRYSGNEEFLKKDIIPMSEDFLDFYISYAKVDSLGKMRIRNSQAIEAYWDGVENDLPTVAGLHAVIKDFTTLPSSTCIPESLAKKVEYISKMVPDIPTRLDAHGNKVFAPAGDFVDRVRNCQNPELMTIFPFELCNFTTEDVEVGRNSFKNRKFIFRRGWTSDFQEAAILGMTDSAKTELLNRIENHDEACKFPSYFGPNFDWVPDQSHGGNLMTGLQDMILQAYDGKVYLLPAFPKDWDVQFKFAVPGQAFVWGNYSSGKWIEKPESSKTTTEIIF